MSIIPTNNVRFFSLLDHVPRTDPGIFHVHSSAAKYFHHTHLLQHLRDKRNSSSRPNISRPEANCCASLDPSAMNTTSSAVLLAYITLHFWHTSRKIKCECSKSKKLMWLAKKTHNCLKILLYKSLCQSKILRMQLGTSIMSSDHPNGK